MGALQTLLGSYGGSSAPPIAIVAGAGTPEVDGNYTERGTFESKPYYNLVGQPDDVENSVIVWGLGTWFINDASAASQYFSTEDVAKPWEVVVWTRSGGSDPIPTVTEG